MSDQVQVQQAVVQPENNGEPQPQAAVPVVDANANDVAPPVEERDDSWKKHSVFVKLVVDKSESAAPAPSADNTSTTAPTPSGPTAIATADEIKEHFETETKHSVAEVRVREGRPNSVTVVFETDEGAEAAVAMHESEWKKAKLLVMRAHYRYPPWEKIFVSGLPVETNDEAANKEMVQELFANNGFAAESLKNISLLMDRATSSFKGVAFVEMDSTDNAISALDAIKGTKGFRNSANVVDVTFAKKDKITLRASNIPYSVNEDEVRRRFADYADAITRVHLPLDRETNQPRGLAFLDFKDREVAFSCIAKENGAEFNGRAMFLERMRDDASSRGPFRGGRGGGPPRGGGPAPYYARGAPPPAYGPPRGYAPRGGGFVAPRGRGGPRGGMRGGRGGYAAPPQAY